MGMALSEIIIAISGRQRENRSKGGAEQRALPCGSSGGVSGAIPNQATPHTVEWLDPNFEACHKAKLYMWNRR
jgi:hypothetical protein